MTVNPFVPNGISRLYQLNESISILGCVVVIFSFKSIRILIEYSVNSIDSDQIPRDFVVVFVALRPMSTAMVIAGRSVHLTALFPGQA